MTYLVTEDAFDAALWKRLLAACEVTGVKVIGAGGRSAAVSAANTLLVMKGEPVATVVGAETTDIRRAEEARGLIHRNISFNAADIRSEVFLAIPRIESLLIDDAVFSQRIFGRRFDAREEQRMRRSKEWPTLARLMGTSDREEFERRLLSRLDADAEATKLLARNPLVTDVCGFLADPYHWRRSVAAAEPTV